MPEFSFSLEQLRKQKLFVATPMYGGMAAGMFTRSTNELSNLCTQNGIQLQYYYLFNESLITRARNYCCDEFMRSDCTHLMFIDADIGFNPQDVIALLGQASTPGHPYDIIGGPYPKKCISWEKIKLAVDKGMAEKNPNNLENFVGDYVFNPKVGATSIPLNEPCEVLEIGTGFMLITKEAMKKFVEAYPNLTYRPDHVRTAAFDGSREIHQFFQAEIDQVDFGTEYKKILDEVSSEMDVLDKAGLMELINRRVDEVKAANALRSKRYLSEDYWFCQMAARAGLKIWFCPWMKMQHVGTYVFGGSLADLAQIGAPATADAGALQSKS